MSENLVAKASVSIYATPAAVWEALTNPEMIKQYLFGTQTTTDWKEGSPITYKGVWQGKEYVDKGTVLRNIPEKVLESTYWSSMSGLPDTPQNYSTVTFELTPEGDTTTLTVTQSNNRDEESRKHSEDNWNMVLQGIKSLVETKKT